MNDTKAAPGSDILVDLGQTSLKVLEGERGLEVPLNRTPQGRLTEEARSAVHKTLTPFLRTSSRRGRPALCALPAGGVSVRRFTLPPASREATRRLLKLQMEQAFPVPPEDLAWGYRIYGSRNGFLRSERPTPQEVAVLALRREVLEDHVALFSGIGLKSVFTLGALAASRLCPMNHAAFTLVDIGRSHTEWLRFQHGKPAQVKTFHWGGETVTEAITTALHLGREKAEQRKIDLSAESGGADPALQACLEEAVKPLARFLIEPVPGRGRDRGDEGPEMNSLVGGGSRLEGLEPILAGALGETVPVKVLETRRPEGQSAVTLGLRVMEKRPEEHPAIHFRTRAGNGVEDTTANAATLRPWIYAAVGLILLVLVLRYVPPLWKLGGLRDHIARTEAALDALPPIGKDLDFMATLDRSRVPVLEVLTVFGRVAPPEAVLQDFTLDARGLVGLKVQLKPGEVNGLRTRLTQSGWFSDVILQDLKRAPKRKVIIRLTARMTPPATGLEGVEPFTPPAGKGK